MDKLDHRTAKARPEEDRTLPEGLQEPGFFPLVFSTMQGRQAWIVWFLMVVQTLMFLTAIWAGWHFYAATEVLVALKWGLSAAVLLVLSLQIKMMTLFPHMQANRILLALRRIELMILQARSG